MYSQSVKHIVDNGHVPRTVFSHAVRIQGLQLGDMDPKVLGDLKVLPDHLLGVDLLVLDHIVDPADDGLLAPALPGVLGQLEPPLEGALVLPVVLDHGGGRGLADVPPVVPLVDHLAAPHYGRLEALPAAAPVV